VEDLDYFGNVRNIPKEKLVLGVPLYGYGFCH
jgi:spore germination protein YaaH